MKPTVMLVSCPNCGGDDQPWFAGAPDDTATYEHECPKCLHRFIYRTTDVVLWPSMRPLAVCGDQEDGAPPVKASPTSQR